MHAAPPAGEGDLQHLGGATMASSKSKKQQAAATERIISGLAAVVGLDPSASSFEVLRTVAETLGCTVAEDGTTELPSEVRCRAASLCARPAEQVLWKHSQRLGCSSHLQQTAVWRWPQGEEEEEAPQRKRRRGGASGVKAAAAGGEGEEDLGSEDTGSSGDELEGAEEGSDGEEEEEGPDEEALEAIAHFSPVTIQDKRKQAEVRAVQVVHDSRVSLGGPLGSPGWLGWACRRRRLYACLPTWKACVVGTANQPHAGSAPQHSRPHMSHPVNRCPSRRGSPRGGASLSG